MLTREEYLNGECTHEEYYEEIAKEAGISYDNSPELSRIKHKLSTDPHLNNIPLSIWDTRGIRTEAAIHKALKKRGDGWSLAESVCVHKAAAIRSARTN